MLIDGPGFELLEPKHRIVGHQGRIVFDAFIGDRQVGDNAPRQLIKWAQLFTTGSLMAYLSQTEVFWRFLEPRNSIEPLRVSEEAVQGRAINRRQLRLDDRR